ncbi:MAG: uroporphyrinogen decarboxylase family protein [Anaerolineales bacterium]
MNHRERVLTALSHEEPDRVPIDLGATQVSGIMAIAYQEFREYLGLGPGITRVMDIYQQTALIEQDMRELLDLDTLPIFQEPNEWQDGTLANGAEAKFPAKFNPQIQEDGSRIVLDANGNIKLKMPSGGHYYDFVHMPLSDATSITDIETCMDEIEKNDEPEHLDKDYTELAAKAKRLREETDYLLTGYFGGHIMYTAQSLRGWDTFLLDLLINEKLARALMEKLVEAHFRRIDRFASTIGKYVDVVEFDEDLGMQDRTLMRPSLYRKMLKPYQKRMFEYAKSKCDAYILFHSDGAIAPFFPDFVEMGIDIVNPIQVSADGMDTQTLKKEFGDDITFWGGTCDTQETLPFGSPEEVVDEVKRRIDDLAPGGGFVFAPVHNIQIGVPCQNIEALFETAKTYGSY